MFNQALACTESATSGYSTTSQCIRALLGQPGRVKFIRGARRRSALVRSCRAHWADQSFKDCWNRGLPSTISIQIKESEQNYAICNNNDKIWKKLITAGKMKANHQIKEFDQIQEGEKNKGIWPKHTGIWTKLQEFEQNSGIGIRLRNLKKIKECDKIWEIRNFLRKFEKDWMIWN